MRKKLVILGSTGSIGTQALDVVQAFPDYFQLQGISCFSNIDLLIQQVHRFKPLFISVATEEQRLQVKSSVDYSPDIFVGDSGLIQLATIDLDLLLVAIVGTAALLPVVSAIKQSRHIAIANKEVLVAAGAMIMDMVKQYGAKLIPVDSEHSALFQCLATVDFNYDNVKTLTLTASGGPFWDRDPNSFDSITPVDALKHPNWDMGAKITIDSATMMNKGLEVIEAFHLFGMSFDNIEVVIHPKSIVHSFIETIDGAIFAHLGRPDMRYPIQYALTYPQRFETPWEQAKLTELSGLEFFEPNHDVFPLLKMAYECGRQGGAAPIILNAANEAVVDLFLKERISFTDIPIYIQQMLDHFSTESIASIDDVIALDRAVKSYNQTLTN